jgi:oligopeptide/dipeptide ABC transporter ATP-binding protein
MMLMKRSTASTVASAPFATEASPGGTSAPLLEVSGLVVEFPADDQTIRAVRGLSYQIRRGEAFGLVGESGSGKSVSARAVLGLLPQSTSRIVSGSIRLDGAELIGLPGRAMQAIRGSRIALVPQNPHASLNPVLTIGRQISEVLTVHRGMRGRAASRQSAELLALVGIPDAARRMDDHPHQFSGGMRQRVIIAIALACEPELLIADEPTTALDVTIQAQIIDLLRRLKDEFGMAVLLITHDLGIVAGFTDRVGVMYAGRIVETGSTEAILSEPTHPYTVGLLHALPRLDRPRRETLLPIPGSPPDLALELPGCAFAARCAWRVAPCWTDLPAMEPAPGRSGAAGVRDPHLAACHNVPTDEEQRAGRPLRDGFVPAARP